MSEIVLVYRRTVNRISVSRPRGPVAIYRGARGPAGAGEPGPQGEPGPAGAGVSFASDPGPVVAPGERVLWVRPSGGSYSLIVREG